MRKYWLILVLFCLSCKVENQKQSEIFLGQDLPRTLFKIANQIHELISLERKISTAQESSCQPDCLDVAVIDNGVDLAHPDLYPSIRFDVKDQQIIGAGYDFLGEDPFGSSNLFDPTMFAFGATSVQNGRIQNPLPNPLERIASHHHSFVAELLKRLASDENLKGTLFDRLTADQLDLYAIHKMVLSKKAFLDLIDQRKKLYGLLKRGDVGQLEDNPKWLDPAIFYLLENRGWSDGMNTYGPYMEGFSYFLEVAEKALRTFPQAAVYRVDLNNLMTYLDGRDFSESDDQEMRNNTCLDKLSKALNKKLYGQMIADTIYNQTMMTELTGLQESWVRHKKVVMPAHRSQFLQSSLDQNFKFYGELIGQIKKLPLTMAEKVSVQQVEKTFPKYVKLSQWVGKERRLSEVDDILGRKAHFDSHLYRKRFARSQHPFFSEKSAEQSHGSHVSGIILSQSPHLRIVPVRVTTESLQLPKDIRQEYALRFKKNFGEWLQLPLVFRALGGRLASVYPQWNFSDDSAANRLKVSQEILSLLDESISLSVENEILDHVFIEDIVKAVHYVGSQQIKVANISLGTTFEKPMSKLGPENPLNNLKDFYKFLKFEFFKYQVGAEIRKSAMETIFVVAAGNESTWVDGRSRSALPVDISSPFLRAFERPDLGEMAPNNGLKNILAVGSINKDDELSNYTNVFLGQHVPFVFARGEMILSAVKSMDYSGVSQALSLWEPNLNSLHTLGVTDQRLKPFLIEKWKELRKTSVDPTEAELEYFVVNLAYKMAVMYGHSDLFKNHLAVKFPEHRARLSGTSMASPTVAGALGKLILEKKKTLSLQGQNIYAHPSFRAEVLVQELLAKTEMIDPSMSLYGLKKLIGTLEMKDDEQALDHFLKSL